MVPCLFFSFRLQNMLRYWIVNGNQSNYVPFRITDGGKILVNGSIDRELTDSYTFKVGGKVLFMLLIFKICKFVDL